MNTDYKLIKNKLETKKAVQPCDACGETQIGISPEPERIQLDNGSYISTILTYCKNCGFLRMHSESVLLE